MYDVWTRARVRHNKRLQLAGRLAALAGVLAMPHIGRLSAAKAPARS